MIFIYLSYFEIPFRPKNERKCYKKENCLFWSRKIWNFLRGKDTEKLASFRGRNITSSTHPVIGFWLSLVDVQRRKTWSYLNLKFILYNLEKKNKIYFLSNFSDEFFFDCDSAFSAPRPPNFTNDMSIDVS